MAKKNRNNLSFVGENIKKIRQAKKLSQADFAKVFNLARASVGAYEEGRSEPKIEMLIAMANYFSISIDALLTRKLTMTEIFKFNRVNEKLDQVHQLKGKGLKKIPSVKLIRTTQYLDYVTQRSNSDYIDAMEQVGLPASINATIAIEMNGGEMTRENQGIRHGDILFGKELDTKDLRDCLDQVVAFALDSEILVRRLKAVEANTITLSADDPAYPNRQLIGEEVLVCWSIMGVYSDKIPRPMQMEDRLLRIEEELKRLRK